MRSHLRISIYMNREMFLYPIPNRDKDISSINTLEFLLRKHYRGIMSCVPYGKYQIRNQKRNNQNFSAIIFHYLNSPLLFTRKHYLCIVQLYNFLLLPPLNTSYCMINRILVLFSITIVSILSSAAQIPIISKNNWIYVDAMLSSKKKNVHTSAIIDTGCTYCLIDSTFAADLQLSTIDTTSISYSTQKTPMSVSRVNLPQLAIGEKVYNNVLCIIVDLQGRAKEYAPSFIIGADIISRDLWNIDLKNSVLSFLTELPQQKQKIKWASRKAIFPNDIILKAEVNGKKGYFFFDTGSRRNELPQSLGIAATKTQQEQTANIAESLSIKELQVVEQAQLKVGFIDKVIDMFITPEKQGYLNAQFLWGKSIVLDYKNKCIFILD